MAKFPEKKIDLLQKNHFWNGKIFVRTLSNFEVWALQKDVNIVDLVNSFPTSNGMYLQNLPKTSLSTFGGASIHSFIRHLKGDPSVCKDVRDSRAAIPRSQLR